MKPLKLEGIGRGRGQERRMNAAVSLHTKLTQIK